MINFNQAKQIKYLDRDIISVRFANQEIWKKVTELTGSFFDTDETGIYKSIHQARLVASGWIWIQTAWITSIEATSFYDDAQFVGSNLTSVKKIYLNNDPYDVTIESAEPTEITIEGLTRRLLGTDYTVTMDIPVQIRQLPQNRIVGMLENGEITINSVGNTVGALEYQNTTIKKVHIPNTVNRIYRGAFSSSPIESVYVSRRTQIDDGTFDNSVNIIFYD